jgi:hypothetical protein
VTPKSLAVRKDFATSLADVLTLTLVAHVVIQKVVQIGKGFLFGDREGGGRWRGSFSLRLRLDGFKLSESLFVLATLLWRQGRKEASIATLLFFEVV